MNKAFVRFVLPLTGLVGLVAIWQFGFMAAGLNPKLFPPPSDIFWTLIRLMTPPAKGGLPPIVGHLAVSLKNIGIAMVIAVTVGPLTGMAMGTSRIVHGALSPFVNMLLPIPPYAYIPIMLLWFGHGSFTIVTSTALAAALPLIYTTSAGTRAIDKRQVFVLRSFGASRAQVVARVVAPAAFASIIAGLRQSFAQAWRTLIGGEFIASAGAGIGYLMFISRDFLAVDVMFCCILVLSVFGMLCIYGLVGCIENRTLRKWGLLADEGARR